MSSDANLLPLERRLKEYAASRPTEFPDRTAIYFERYVTIKAFLNRNYFSVSGAGLALKGERFTRHDLHHVDDVILAAGRLLGDGSADPNPAFMRLTPYEVYVLLLAILLHDAGNASGREAHERAAGSILERLREAIDLEPIEKKLIASIARAHGGRTPTGSKDTIKELLPDDVPHVSGIKVHARRLAAVLKLADELSENPRRADPGALAASSGAPPESIIHNLFCKLINIEFDYVGRTIRIDFDIEKTILAQEFAIKEDNGLIRIFIVDYIRGRLVKSELERQYCHRFLAGFVSYDRIRVKLTVHDGDAKIDELGFDLEDRGYPTEPPAIKEISPMFDGAILRAKHCIVSAEGGVT